jgi:hypothetical protein
MICLIGFLLFLFLGRNQLQNPSQGCNAIHTHLDLERFDGLLDDLLDVIVVKRQLLCRGDQVSCASMRRVNEKAQTSVLQ